MISPIVLMAALWQSCEKSDMSQKKSDAPYKYTADDTTIFSNPERGWFYTIDPIWGTNATAAVLKVSQLNSLKRQYKITLIRKYYCIYAYSTTPVIPSAFINLLQDDLNACRTTGFKLIPRFTYVWNRYGFPNGDNDAKEAITNGHVNQLMGILNSNYD